jgi:nucleotide-binding universal stress UspA family protein
MIEIKQILCPIDFSDFSRRALDHAVTLARWYGASVTALHVIPPIPSLLPLTPTYGSPIVFTPEDIAQFERHVVDFAREPDSTQPVQPVVLQGSVTGEIIRVAEALPADLLVMGTHGRSGFDRLMLGSITERMLRKAPCPLLTVPAAVPDVVPRVAEPFRRILCAVDFFPSSRRALTLAESLAKEADAALDVLHVLEPVSVLQPVPMGAGGDPTINPEALAAARQRLRDATTWETREYSHVSPIVVGGKPYVEILREADERRSELIVMGAYGGHHRFPVFGSTTNQVLRVASCPVLTVRA